MSPESGLFENIYLITFLFGLVFTVVSVVLGASHVGGFEGHHGAHLGDVGGHVAHIGDLGGHHVGDLGAHAGHVGDIGGHAGDAGHVHVGAQTGHNGSGTAIPHPDVHIAHGATDSESALDALSIFNMPTIMAFLTWFGGAGYILTRTFSMGPVFSAPLAIVSGLTGGAIMFVLLARVLWPMRSKPLSTADFRLPGTAARVVSSIREGGVGEIVYNKAGNRFTAGARAVNGQPVAKGTEVVIVRYERGLAYVQPVDELLGEITPPPSSESAATRS